MMMMMSFVLDLHGDDDDVLDQHGEDDDVLCTRSTRYLDFYEQTASRHILYFRDNQSVHAKGWINP